MSGRPLKVLLVAVGLRPEMLAGTAWREFIETVERFATVDRAMVEVHRDLRLRILRRTFQLRKLAGRSTVAETPSPTDHIADLEEFDLALLLCPGPFDLYALRDLGPRLRRCRKVVAWPIETWPTQRTKALGLEPIEWFDRIFAASHSGAAMLDDVWGASVPVEYLPLAVDTVRFSAAARQDRPLLAFNPGRRSPTQHRSLKDAAARSDRLYLFDTLSSPAASDPVEHRELYARITGRSDLMICNFAKFDRPDETGAAREIPARLFEALAAGALPYGTSPARAALADANLPTDIVSPFSIDESTPPHAIIGQSEEGAATTDARVDLARRNHDWAHRWVQICRSLGLDPGQAATEYVNALAASGR